MIIHVLWICKVKYGALWGIVINSEKFVFLGYERFPVQLQIVVNEFNKFCSCTIRNNKSEKTISWEDASD